MLIKSEMNWHSCTSARRLPDELIP